MSQVIKAALKEIFNHLPDEGIRGNSDILDDITRDISKQLETIESTRPSEVIDEDFILSIINSAVQRGIQSSMSVANGNSNTESNARNASRTSRSSINNESTNNVSKQQSVVEPPVTRRNVTSVYQKYSSPRDNMSDIQVQTSMDANTIQRSRYSCPCSDPKCFKFEDYNGGPIPPCCSPFFSSGSVPQTLVFCTGCPCSPRSVSHEITNTDR